MFKKKYKFLLIYFVFFYVPSTYYVRCIPYEVISYQVISRVVSYLIGIKRAKGSACLDFSDFGITSSISRFTLHYMCLYNITGEKWVLHLIMDTIRKCGSFLLFR